MRCGRETKRKVFESPEDIYERAAIIVKKLEEKIRQKMLKRKIKIVEFDDNRIQFITNYLAPLRIIDIKEEGEVVTVTGADTKTKGLIIGIKAQNLRNLEKVISKYFTIEEIKVI